MATPTGTSGMKQSKLEDLYRTAQDDIQVGGYMLISSPGPYQEWIWGRGRGGAPGPELVHHPPPPPPVSSWKSFVTGELACTPLSSQAMSNMHMTLKNLF